MVKPIIGWVYCYLWYSSILSGYTVLYCPFLPILLFSNKLYRYLTDVTFTFWQYYNTALLQILCDSHVQVTGDPIIAGEMSLLIMNHRTRTDWNFLWPTFYHCVKGNMKIFHSMKFVLKDIIRNIPGPGWVMQLTCFVYIRRKWEEDVLTFQKYIDYVSKLNYNFTLVLFPEGTDLTESTKLSSDRFAEKNNLQKYNHVLHPRTTGFSYIAAKLLERDHIDAIYDVTIIYPDTIPQNEKMLLNGEFPHNVFLHFTRYNKSEFPTTEFELKKFLEQRWSDKEKIITEYKLTGRFLHGQPQSIQTAGIMATTVFLVFYFKKKLWPENIN